MIARLGLAVFIAVTTVSVTDGQDNSQFEKNWHQWRGPQASGFTSVGDPPATWSETENIAWRVPIEGEGSSTPIIWADKVFVLSAVVTDRKPEKLPVVDEQAKTRPPENIVQFVVWCLDRNNGKTIWKNVVTEATPHEGRHPSTTYAASSPVTDGKHLYVSFGSYGVYCLTLDGKVVWSKDLGDMRTRRGWGEAVSPVLHDNQLVVMWDQEDQSSIFVLNSSDGSVVWQQQRDEPTTWATPVVATQGKKTQVITCGTNKVRSYDIKTGDLLWSTGGLTLNAIPCPVLADDHVICMSGYQGNKAVSIDLASAGGGTSPTSPTTSWQLDRDTPYVPSPLVTDGRVYFTKSLAAIVSCVDVKTGEPIFQSQRLPGLNNLYASPVATNKYVYFASREGKTLVIRNDPKFEVVATNQIDGGLDASPAISGDQIFLRTKTHLYCIARSNDSTEIANDGSKKSTSVVPGINKSFLDPNLDVQAFVDRFEIESREIFSARLEVLRECQIRPGMKVADIGAGTGLFSRMFARTVGTQGWVYAVDIAPQFLKHIRQQIDELGLQNITPVLCAEDSASLPVDSIDLAFICDTYHHFEYPKSTMNSIHRAMKQDARLIVIDFERIPGISREWLLGHVRAGKSVFRKEIEDAGFELVREIQIPGFTENYCLEFRKTGS